MSPAARVRDRTLHGYVAVAWSDSAFASVSWADSTSPTSADVSWADGAAGDYLKGGYKMSPSDYAAVK